MLLRRNLWALALGLAIVVSSLPFFPLRGVAASGTLTIGITQDANLGTILTGPNGMTLYRFDKDSPGVSNCYDQCALNWPPLLVSDGEDPMMPAGLKGTVGTTTRKDGSVQVTFNGWPLYYWSRDKQPGDTTGQNFNKLWFVMNPDGPTVRLSQDPSLGSYLTDANGMTLYVFTKDSPGTATCYNQCAANWPPLLLQAGESLNAPPGLGGRLDAIARTDGTRQVTLNGAPLYHWARDKAPGETTGNKVNGVWFVAEPGLLLDTAGTWAQSQISAAVRSGWIKGNPDGTYKPQDEMTRAEFVTALTQALQTPSSPSPAGFTDVGSHWAAPSIQAALAAGIIQSPDYADGRFEPDRSITREEVMVMLVRALGLEGTAGAQERVLQRFSDRDHLTTRGAPLVAVAVEQGLVQGYPDQTIRGEKTVNRAEAVVLVIRALARQK